MREAVRNRNAPLLTKKPPSVRKNSLSSSPAQFFSDMTQTRRFRKNGAGLRIESVEEYGTWLRIGRSEEILQEGIGSFWQKIWRFIIGCKGRGYMKQKSESEDKNWRYCATHRDFDALISTAAGLVSGAR